MISDCCNDAVLNGKFIFIQALEVIRDDKYIKNYTNELIRECK